MFVSRNECSQNTYGMKMKTNGCVKMHFSTVYARYFFLLLFLHCTLSVIRSLYCICLWLDRIKVPSQMRGRWKKAMQFVFICFSRAFLIVLGFFFWQTTFALFNGLQFSNILQLVIAVFEVIQASYCVVFYIVFFFSRTFPI